MRRSILLPLLVVAAAAPARAQEPPPEAAAPTTESAAPAAPAGSARVLRLHVADVGRLALRNSPRFRALALEPSIARTFVDEARGEFDPLVGARLTGGRTRSEVFFSPGSFGGGSDFAVDETWRGNVGVTGVAEWGGAWSASYDATSTSHGGASSIASLAPRYDGLLSLGYVHPLLRGAGRDVRLSHVREAERRTSASESQLARAAELTVAEAESLYWDLVSAIADRDVLLTSRALALELLDVARARVDAGRGIPADVAEAEAGLARRDGELIDAEARIGNLADRLRELVLPFGGPEGDLDLLVQPADTAPQTTGDAPADPGRELLESALARRGDVQAAVEALGAAQLAERRLRNAAQIELNALVNGGLTGMGSGVRDAARQIGDGEDYRWEAGLEVAIPLCNVAEDARLLRAERETARAEREVAAARNSAVRDVREAVRNVRAALERIAAAERERVATEAQLAAERSRLEQGKSTPFLVLEVEEDRSRAVASQTRARTDLAKAHVALDAALGGLLERRGLVEAAAGE